MASALYDKGRESFLKAELNLPTDNIKAVLVDNGAYVVDLANDQFLSAIAVGARISTSPNLATKTTAAGVFDADDVTFTAVVGPTVEDVVLYQDTGNPATSRLIAYIDSATGLPLTPNGGDVTVVWSNGANRIFKL
jgi:hypothetical protein